MKKTIRIASLILCAVTFMSFGLFCGCWSADKWSKYFDLSDEKIPFNELWLDAKPNDRFKDTVYICLKKQIKTIKLTVNDFNNANIVSLRYINFEPDPNKVDDKEYMDNFRQDLCLLLTDVTNGEVKTIIREIEKLEFVKEISIIRAVHD